MTKLRRPRLLLELDLTRDIVEVEPEDLPGRLRARGSLRWRSMIEAVAAAVDDRRVAGLVATLGTGLPLALAQELTPLIAAVRASGKPCFAWAETLGESGVGASAMIVAAGFGEVWLQPSGTVGLTGVAAEVTFMRGALDKLGVRPQLGQRREYKSAADRIMRTDFTPAHEEMMQRLTDSCFDQIVGAIATGRSLPAEAVVASIEAGPLSAEAALAAGLIDRLGYRDEAYSAARAACEDDVRLLFAEHFHRRTPPTRRLQRAVTRPPAIALVDLQGTITDGRSRQGLTGRNSGSATVAAQLRAATADKQVAAVVLRVDSPGGSAVASDTIWRETRRVREAGKPLIVSMGSLAASGGYYVASDADVIVADAATLTGSIGVVGGKFDIEGLLERLGIGTGAVERGAQARMFSTRRPFTDAELDRLELELDAVYGMFKARVGQGRSMSADQVEEIARGRVWTGADAAERGLVDRIGGLHDAVQLARDRAGLPATAALRPPARAPLGARLRPPVSSEDPRSTALLSPARGALGLDLVSLLDSVLLLDPVSLFDSVSLLSPVSLLSAAGRLGPPTLGELTMLPLRLRA